MSRKEHDDEVKGEEGIDESQNDEAGQEDEDARRIKMRRRDRDYETMLTSISAGFVSVESGPVHPRSFYQ
jgi:hypothetical protein